MAESMMKVDIIVLTGQRIVFLMHREYFSALTLVFTTVVRKTAAG